MIKLHKFNKDLFAKTKDKTGFCISDNFLFYWKDGDSFTYCSASDIITFGEYEEKGDPSHFIVMEDVIKNVEPERGEIFNQKKVL